jgi:hypothetical protein
MAACWVPVARGLLRCRGKQMIACAGRQPIARAARVARIGAPLAGETRATYGARAFVTCIGAYRTMDAVTTVQPVYERGSMPPRVRRNAAQCPVAFGLVTADSGVLVRYLAAALPVPGSRGTAPVRSHSGAADRWLGPAGQGCAGDPGCCRGWLGDSAQEAAGQGGWAGQPAPFGAHADGFSPGAMLGAVAAAGESAAVSVAS